MKTNYTIEIQRHNVTPAQFLAYVRRRLKATGGDAFCGCLDLGYFAAGSEPNYDTTRDGAHCISRSKPYDMQTYISDGGRLYNEICEFEFDDEKTGYGYYYLIDAEADETTETAPAAEPETETTAGPETAEMAAKVINPMCAECVKHGASCPGTTCQDYTGCVRRETAHRSAAELVEELRARKWSVCKRDLLALTDGGSKPLRWACIRYKLSFYDLDPYYMGAELMAEGVRIAYDDTAISPAKNRAERRRVERIYATREGARA